MIMFLLVAPAITYMLIEYYSLKASQKDLYISRASALCTMVGFFMIFIAETPPVLILGVITISLGTLYGISTVSVATSLVPPDHVASLYATISAVNSVGVLISGPVFAAIYSYGLILSLSWSGLPFGVASFVFILVLLVVFCVKVPT
jgi:MFS family permease